MFGPIICKSFISNTNHFCPLIDRQKTASSTIKLQKIVKQPVISIFSVALSCLPLNVDEHIPKSISIFHMTIRIQYNKREIDYQNQHEVIFHESYLWKNRVNTEGTHSVPFATLAIIFSMSLGICII